MAPNASKTLSPFLSTSHSLSSLSPSFFLPLFILLFTLLLLHPLSFPDSLPSAPAPRIPNTKTSQDTAGASQTTAKHRPPSWIITGRREPQQNHREAQQDAAGHRGKGRGYGKGSPGVRGRGRGQRGARIGVVTGGRRGTDPRRACAEPTATKSGF